MANRERPEQLGFSAAVILAQLRSIVVDLLRATGAGHEEADTALPPVDDPSPG